MPNPEQITNELRDLYIRIGEFLVRCEQSYDPEIATMAHALNEKLDKIVNTNGELN